MHELTSYLGGGSGIGLMAIQALAVNGAKVYICGRTEEKLDTVAKTYNQGISGKIIPVTCDITKKDEIARLYDEISSKEKQLDILINNAGIATHSFQTESKSAEEMKKNLFEPKEATFEDWDDVYRTNVTQIYFMTTAFLPLLQKSTENSQSWSGTVLNMTSISGQVKIMQHHAQYNASKAAAIHVSRMLASECQVNGIKVRINNIAPGKQLNRCCRDLSLILLGVFPSEMTRGESGENQKSHIPKENFEGKVPADRPGNDRDMAGAVLFAVTNQYFNGETVTVDGGYVLRAGR